LNEEPGVHLFRTTLWLAAASGISQVFEYSTEYSSSKKLDLHSPRPRSQPQGSDLGLKCLALTARF